MVRWQFLWGVVLVLFLALVVQLAMWRENHEAKKHLYIKDFTSINQQHEQLRLQIDQSKEKLQQLNTAMLWEQPELFLPRFSKAINELPVELVGVEEIAQAPRAGYQSSPLRLTFSGDYAGFSALLSTVEQIVPPIRVDATRIYQRPKYPSTLWMSLTVASMYNEAVKTRTEIEIPVSAQLRIGRNPFAFDEVTDTPPPISNKKSFAPKMPLPKLTGILWSEKRPMAIFTDHLSRAYLAGVDEEVVADAKVIAIHPQHVVLMQGGIKHELGLFDENPDDTTHLTPPRERNNNVSRAGSSKGDRGNVPRVSPQTYSSTKIRPNQRQRKLPRRSISPGQRKRSQRSPNLK